MFIVLIHQRSTPAKLDSYFKYTNDMMARPMLAKDFKPASELDPKG